MLRQLVQIICPTASNAGRSRKSDSLYTAQMNKYDRVRLHNAALRRIEKDIAERPTEEGSRTCERLKGASLVRVALAVAGAVHRDQTDAEVLEHLVVNYPALQPAGRYPGAPAHKAPIRWSEALIARQPTPRANAERLTHGYRRACVVRPAPHAAGTTSCARQPA